MDNYFNATGTIGFTCDNCGRELQGCTWVNGMRFCAKCYQETFGNNNMSENLKNMYDAYSKILDEKDQRISELEEQLANAIVLPKYEKGQPIYYICGDKIIEAYFQGFDVDINADVIENPQIVTDEDGFTGMDYDFGFVDYRLIYATRAEAEAKLKEIK